MANIRMMCHCKAHCFNFGLGDGDEKDEDEFDDENNGANDPGNPIWEGSEVHDNWRGTDTTVPDANEVNQD